MGIAASKAVCGQIALLVLLSQLLLPASADAQEARAADAQEAWGEPLAWRWQRMGAENYLITATGAAIAVTFQIAAPLPTGRAGGLWFDERVRDTFRLGEIDDRLIARDVSDVLLATATAYPFFDAVVVAGWYRRSPEVAEQMALINAETFAVTAALQGITKFAIGRERPYGRECGNELPEDTRACDTDDRFRSFFSGHTSQSFASAALACTHHMYLDLYGPDAAALPCVSAFGLAFVTGALRVLGDRHYLTDVIMGATVGSAVGFSVPILLHYNQPSARSLTLVPSLGGLSVAGEF